MFLASLWNGSVASRFQVATFASALLVVTLASGCAGSREEAPPAARGIVLVSVDAFRADLLSTYGGDVAMASLDRLASLGVTFENASTPCPMSRPAAVSLLTGVAPDRSGVRDDIQDRLPSGTATLASLFEAAGRGTAAIVSTPLCSRSSGLASGFELFEGPEDPQGGPGRRFPPVTSDAEIAQRFAVWLGTVATESRFFAWLHLAGLHGAATSTNEAEDSAAAYRETLKATDEALASVIAALETAGRLDSTAVVVAGTHGVLLGEDGAQGSAYWLRTETLRVPLVVKGTAEFPGLARGTRRDDAVWLPDVAATLAVLGGTAPPLEGEGIDLTRNAPAGESRTRFAWSWAPEDDVAWPTLTAVDDGGGWRSFSWDDLGAAAAAGEPEPALLAARSRPATPRKRELPQELVERLLSQGALADVEEVAAHPASPTAREDLLRRIQVARYDFGRGSPAGRIRARRILKEYPDNLAAMEAGLYVIVSSRQKIVAAELADRVLDLYPLRPEILHRAAHARQLAGEGAEGELLLEAALAAAEGTDAELIYDLACARALAGDTGGALDRLSQAIDAGYHSWAHIEQDPDLVSIRGDPRYGALLGAHGR